MQHVIRLLGHFSVLQKYLQGSRQKMIPRQPDGRFLQGEQTRNDAAREFTRSQCRTILATQMKAKATTDPPRLLHFDDHTGQWISLFPARLCQCPFWFRSKTRSCEGYC
jgi:hypothetical protein